MLIRPAKLADVPAICGLATSELPTMTAIHDPVSWRLGRRFGDGSKLHGSCTLVACESSDPGSVVAFIWADDALYSDNKIDEPWWCINALAVQPHNRLNGVASALVTAVRGKAATVGVNSLYGLSRPSATLFWAATGFTVTRPGQGLRSIDKVRRLSGAPTFLHLPPDDVDVFFVSTVRTTLRLPGTALRPA